MPEQDNAHVPAGLTTAPLVPAQPDEPDYSDLALPHWAECRLLSGLAPLLVIGLGAVGQAVLETLASWLPRPDVLAPSLSMLCVRLANEPAPSYALPDTGGSEFGELDTLVLKTERAAEAFPWYALRPEDNWARPDGRLGVYQDVRSEPSGLWETLQARLGGSVERQVWLVGTAFDPIGSGMVFDLAHLVRVVAQQQKYHPFIGWLLALPNDAWAKESLPDAAACLREIVRLKHPDLLRVQEYSPQSTNRSLQRQVLRQDADADAEMIVLCEPSEELYGQQAAELLVNRMALTLLTLTQAQVWEQFYDEWYALGTSRRRTGEVLVSAIGVSGHYVPLVELQELVRTWLARDVLLGEEHGALPSSHPPSEQPNTILARQLLQQASHPFLRAIAGATAHSARPTRWPSPIRAKRALAVRLREHLQRLIDSRSPSGGLAACEALLTGLEAILFNSRAPPESLAELGQIVDGARNELRGWLDAVRTLGQLIELEVRRAEKAWADALQRPGWRSMVRRDTARATYSKLIDGIEDIRLRMQEYVRWAWLSQGDSLRLCLDTLYPNWRTDQATWRHASAQNDHESLWRGATQVVRAWTQDAQYWPSSLTEEGMVLPSSQQVETATALMLSYDASKAHAVVPTRRASYQGSGDQEWRNQTWFPANVTHSRASAWTSAVGLLLQVHHLVPLTAIDSWSKLCRAYARRRHAWRELHVFEPEQRAAEIEGKALRTLGIARRRQLAQRWLSAETVAALQWRDMPRFFLCAWCAGRVMPSSGMGPYRLTVTREEQRADILDLRGDHPIEAMRYFVSQNHESKFLREQSAAHMPSADSDSQGRIELIREWWRSSDHRDVEWWILVHGLIGRMDR